MKKKTAAAPKVNKPVKAPKKGAGNKPKKEARKPKKLPLPIRFYS